MLVVQPGDGGPMEDWLNLELLRKKTTDPKRALELAAYFTHCNLQPAHTMLALKAAMTAA